MRAQVAGAEARQLDDKAGSTVAVDGAFHPYRAVVVLDNTVNQRQTQPRAPAGRFAGDKRLEQGGTQFLGNAVAAILHLDAHLVAVLFTEHADRVVRVAGVRRVAEQVDEHLQQALGVADHFQIRRAVVLKALCPMVRVEQ